MNEATKIIAEQVADEMLRIKASESATDAIMYLRSLVGNEFDDVLHEIAKRAGENARKGRLETIE